MGAPHAAYLVSPSCFLPVCLLQLATNAAGPREQLGGDGAALPSDGGWDHPSPAFQVPQLPPSPIAHQGLPSAAALGSASAIDLRELMLSLASAGYSGGAGPAAATGWGGGGGYSVFVLSPGDSGWPVGSLQPQAPSRA